MGRPAHSTPAGEALSEDVDEPGTPLLRSPITTEESAFASSVIESRQDVSQEHAADLATAPYPTQVQISNEAPPAPLLYKSAGFNLTQLISGKANCMTHIDFEKQLRLC